MQADPYIVIELGKKKLSDKDNYCPNTIAPVFGRYIELKFGIKLCLPIMGDSVPDGAL